MAKRKRERRASIRGMSVDPGVLDSTVWQQAEPSPANEDESEGDEPQAEDAGDEPRPAAD